MSVIPSISLLAVFVYQDVCMHVCVCSLWCCQEGIWVIVLIDHFLMWWFAAALNCSAWLLYWKKRHPASSGRRLNGGGEDLNGRKRRKRGDDWLRQREVSGEREMLKLFLGHGSFFSLSHLTRRTCKYNLQPYICCLLHKGDLLNAVCYRPKLQTGKLTIHHL